MDELITTYKASIGEAGCAPGSGRYGVQVDITEDISPVFPYLNALLDETKYDHEGRILIWQGKDRAYALRPHEIKIIQTGGVNNPQQAAELGSEIVVRLNAVWGNRNAIVPRFTEKTRPSVVEILNLLPRTNCKQCGCVTCLVFAAALREGKASLEACPPLAEPRWAAI